MLNYQAVDGSTSARCVQRPCNGSVCIDVSRPPNMGAMWGQRMHGAAAFRGDMLFSNRFVQTVVITGGYPLVYGNHIPLMMVDNG